jgi:Tfp pilus assembly PilM family ATPase
MPNIEGMGLKWLTRTISSQPIAIHFGNDIVRMMQIRGAKERVLQSAVEVASTDSSAIKVALASFKGNRCVISIASSDVLVQHIRVALDADEAEIRHRLVKHDVRWEDAEIRNVCITTTGGSGKPRQEILCVGIECKKTQEIISIVEGAGGEVIAVTVPLYASIRAFDQLYRRDGDEKITSLLIDMDEDTSMVMIAHGASCVFAHRLASKIIEKNDEVEQQWESIPSLTPISPGPLENAPERRCENEPRGLHITKTSTESIEEKLERALVRCLRHHDALFPDRTVDRVIFTGSGANATESCAAIASKLGISGYIADPSAWVSGAEDCATGPAWTTAAGICMRYAEQAA